MESVTRSRPPAISTPSPTPGKMKALLHWLMTCFCRHNHRFEGRTRGHERRDRPSMWDRPVGVHSVFDGLQWENERAFAVFLPGPGGCRNELPVPPGRAPDEHRGFVAADDILQPRCWSGNIGAENRRRRGSSGLPGDVEQLGAFRDRPGC